MTKISRTVSVYPRTAKYSWLFDNALRTIDDMHFDTVDAACQVDLTSIRPIPHAVIIDKTILASSNGEGSRLLQNCHSLGLLVITVAEDNGGFISGDEVPRSNLHLRLL